ncbi:hypothetical protein [Rhizobium sp. P44RR-XXIV]|uniref:hypothetical protein n=1 Tax=Rhizobium sp. P44RR-XXIV TaxID=1921145 RepID=UPI0010AA461C|nr:hypothetical protein [Rhizobium sp. P44RR-XXIV]TIX91117.1 hypothetical protein BSK43_008980 [Rhizobium sp. P44RR-XXIV]
MAPNREARLKTKRQGFDWSHPLVILAATTIIGAIGWAAKEWYSSFDTSNIRVAVENPRQAVKLIGPQPEYSGSPLFCDTVALSLLLTHSQTGDRPISVNGIEMVQEDIPQESPSSPFSSCDVDPLGDRPYGIGERKVFLMMLAPTGSSGRYIEGTKDTEAWGVSPKNLLSGVGHSRVITLEKNEAPVVFEIFVTSQLKRASKVYFRVSFDAGSERSVVTMPVQLIGSGT